MIKIFFSLVMIFTFFSCSSSIEETREEEADNNVDDETYIFDKLPENDNQEDEVLVNKSESSNEYLIQIGAFTTKQNAEEFAEESRKKINDEIAVTYSQDVNLFVVRLESVFRNKADAEKIRDEIRKIDNYRDAWIITVTK